MKNVLVTGANGQLGQCLKELSVIYPAINFVFTNSKTLDIVKKEDIAIIFNNIEFDFCINCAAYTAVDKAEEESERAKSVNVFGAQYLAEVCFEHNTTLIHISTDFVFDGTASKPYSETDNTSPLSVYGQTKLEGEHKIQEILDNYFIIRTSWLYSEYGNNFMKTMLKLGQVRTELSIVGDQIGTPTYAKDLAKVLLKLILDNNKCYGIYHYSNEGRVSWFDFAKEIFEKINNSIKLNEILAIEYPTPAVRPKFSVLCKDKIVNNFEITIPNWKSSLERALGNINNNT